MRELLDNPGYAQELTRPKRVPEEFRASRRAPCGADFRPAALDTMVDLPALDVPEQASRDAQFASEALCWVPEITRLARALTRDPADTDDLVQETFLRAYRFWGSYTPGTDCRRWLVTVCRNAFLSRASRETLVQSVGDDAELDTFATVQLRETARQGGVDHLFEQFELGAAIASAISHLSESYRVVVQMIDVDGATYEEVAVALEVPIGTVRSRLFRARRLLQHELIEHARDAGLATRDHERTAPANAPRGEAR
jgi:RNA polymerase sigma-70 factor (ECF subfamily)